MSKARTQPQTFQSCIVLACILIGHHLEMQTCKGKACLQLFKWRPRLCVGVAWMLPLELVPASTRVLRERSAWRSYLWWRAFRSIQERGHWLTFNPIHIDLALCKGRTERGWDSGSYFWAMWPDSSSLSFNFICKMEMIKREPLWTVVGSRLNNMMQVEGLEQLLACYQGGWATLAYYPSGVTSCWSFPRATLLWLCFLNITHLTGSS